MQMTISQRLGSKFAQWRESNWLWMSRVGELHGLPVAIDYRLRDRREELESNLARALDLISEFHPRRLSQIQRDVGQIWIRPLIHRAEYRYAPQACVLEPRFVAEYPRELVASSIIHEGTHARIGKRRLRLDQAGRDREERICRRAELEFAMRIPNGEAVVARAREGLRPDRGASRLSDWREIEYLTRRAELEASHYPSWLKRWGEGRLRKQYGFEDAAEESSEAPP